MSGGFNADQSASRAATQASPRSLKLLSSRLHQAELRVWLGTFIANSGTVLAGLASSVLAARLLGVHDRGVLAALTFLPLLLVELGALGINEATAIHVARTRSEPSLRTLVLLSVLTATGSLLVAGLVWPLYSSPLQREHAGFIIPAAAILLPFAFLSLSMLGVEQGRLRFRTYNWYSFIRAATYPVALILLWMTGFLTAFSAGIGMLLGPIVIALAQLLRWRPLHATSGSDLFTELLSKGATIHAVNLIGMLYSQIDRFVALKYGDAVFIGLYFVAAAPASIIASVISQTYVTIVLPRLAGVGKTAAGVEFAMRSITAAILVMAVMIGAVVAILPWAFPLVFGAEYRNAVSMSQWLVLAGAFVSAKRMLLYTMRPWSSQSGAIFSDALALGAMLVGFIWIGRIETLPVVFACSGALGFLVQGLYWWRFMRSAVG